MSQVKPQAAAASSGAPTNCSPKTPALAIQDNVHRSVYHAATPSQVDALWVLLSHEDKGNGYARSESFMHCILPSVRYLASSGIVGDHTDHELWVFCLPEYNITAVGRRVGYVPLMHTSILVTRAMAVQDIKKL